MYEEKCLVLLHPLRNIVITKNFNGEARFNVVNSRNILPKLKDVINVICNKSRLQKR